MNQGKSVAVQPVEAGSEFLRAAARCHPDGGVCGDGGGPHSYCLSAGYALTEHGRALCFPPVCAGLWLQHGG